MKIHGHLVEKGEPTDIDGHMWCVARLPGSNPAYVLATQPLRGQRLQVTAKDVASSLPDVARSFVEDLDEDGLWGP